MPTINGYKSSKLIVAENSSVVDGNIVGDNLILARRDLVTFDAGNVRGATGPTGPSGTGAFGKMAYAEKTTTQSGITTTTTDITGLSVTFTAVAGRRYRISAFCHVFSSVANDIAQMRIADSANVTLSLALSELRGSVAMRWEYIVVPGAGSKTYKLRLVRANGTGSLTFDCGATYPAYILAEDIGT